MTDLGKFGFLNGKAERHRTYMRVFGRSYPTPIMQLPCLSTLPFRNLNLPKSVVVASLRASFTTMFKHAKLYFICLQNFCKLLPSDTHFSPIKLSLEVFLRFSFIDLLVEVHTIKSRLKLQMSLFQRTARKNFLLWREPHQLRFCNKLTAQVNA